MGLSRFRDFSGFSREDATANARTELLAAGLFLSCIKEIAALLPDVADSQLDPAVKAGCVGIVDFCQETFAAVLVRTAVVWELRAPYDGLSPLAGRLGAVQAECVGSGAHFSFDPENRVCTFTNPDVLAKFITIAIRANGGIQKDPSDRWDNLLGLALEVPGEIAGVGNRG